MEILTCQLDRTNDVPLYEQLYLFIKGEIIEGRIKYQEKLPSKRRLSEYLKVSQNTIEAAYEQLVAEGYVEALPRKGYYVLAEDDLEFIPQGSGQHVERLEEEEEFKYHFHPSWIDTEKFPFSKWRKYAKDIIDENHHTLLLLGEMEGEKELREEIAHYLYQSRGVHCSPDQVIIGAGSEILLQQLILLFKNDTVYGVEDPGYHIISRILKNYKNKIYPLDVDEEGLKVKQVENTDIDVVYVTPSHHFPYGSVLSINRRVQLLNWARQEANRYVIEDDYDSEFRYSGKAIPSLQSMDKSGKIIYLGSFSKSLIPSLRISYMVLPKRLLKKYKEKLSFYQCTVSRLDQHILTEFMKHGDFERHLNRMRKIYRKKLDKTLDLLKRFQQEINVIGEQSGLHIVLEVNNGMSEEELVQQAKKANVLIHPLSSYSLEKRTMQQPMIILGFAGIPEKKLEEAIGLLLDSWNLKH